MSTPPSLRAAIFTSSKEDSWSISWPWLFCAPAPPPPLALSDTMVLFRSSICDSSLLIWSTPAPIWLSAWPDSCCSCEEIAEDWLRKLWMSETAWSRETLDEGAWVAAVMSAKVCSSWLK